MESRWQRNEVQLSVVAEVKNQTGVVYRNDRCGQWCASGSGKQDVRVQLRKH